MYIKINAEEKCLICGESVPLYPDRTEKIYKSPEDLTEIGKALRALFSPPESVLVFDTTRAEHLAGIMRHLPGELVRLYIRNIRCNKRRVLFRSR